MKLKYTSIIEIKACDSPGFWKITKGTLLIPAGQIMRLEYIRENFRPADCEALDLIDPGRTKRLCQ